MCIALRKMCITVIPESFQLAREDSTQEKYSNAKSSGSKFAFK